MHNYILYLQIYIFLSFIPIMHPSAYHNYYLFIYLLIEWVAGCG